MMIKTQLDVLKLLFKRKKMIVKELGRIAEEEDIASESLVAHFSHELQQKPVIRSQKVKNGATQLELLIARQMTKKERGELFNHLKDEVSVIEKAIKEIKSNYNKRLDTKKYEKIEKLAITNARKIRDYNTILSMYNSPNQSRGFETEISDLTESFDRLLSRLLNALESVHSELRTSAALSMLL